MDQLKNMKSEVSRSRQQNPSSLPSVMNSLQGAGAMLRFDAQRPKPVRMGSGADSGTYQLCDLTSLHLGAPFSVKWR